MSTLPHAVRRQSVGACGSQAYARPAVGPCYAQRSERARRGQSPVKPSPYRTTCKLICRLRGRVDNVQGARGTEMGLRKATRSRAARTGCKPAVSPISTRGSDVCCCQQRCSSGWSDQSAFGEPLRLSAASCTRAQPSSGGLDALALQMGLQSSSSTVRGESVASGLRSGLRRRQEEFSKSSACAAAV